MRHTARLYGHRRLGGTMAGMEELCFFTNITPEVWAAMTQAVLSAAAIVVFVLLVNRQHQQQLSRDAIAEADRKRQHPRPTSTKRPRRAALRWCEV